MAQIDIKIDTIESLTAEKVALKAEKTALLAELTELKETNEESEAFVQTQTVTILELQGQIESMTAERDKYKQVLQNDAGNQSLVLRRIEKIAEKITKQEKEIDSGLNKLTDDEAAVIKVHRQDKINELKAKKEQIRNILTKGATE